MSESNTIFLPGTPAQSARLVLDSGLQRGRNDEVQRDLAATPSAEGASSTRRLLLLTLYSSLALMTSYETFKQMVAPGISIWSSHVITILFSSMVATAGAYVALRRHERLSDRITQENSLRRQAEEALSLLNEKSRELRESKATLEREIAERKLAEAALIERQRELEVLLAERTVAREATAAASSLLSATIESTVDGIMAVDRRGEITACNGRFAEMWGIGEEILGGGDSNTVLLSVLEQLRESAYFFQKFSDLFWLTEQESYDLVELTDGRCFECMSRPQLNSGKVVGRVWSFRDVTELKRLETQLLHAQKMEAIGTLAGGLAHDFNNIMTAIIGYTALLRSELNPAPPYRGFLEKIDESSERAVALIQNLLSYSRKEPAQTTSAECNAMVRNLVSFLERLIGADIELVMNLSSKSLHVMVDARQIEQVLVNLATNARDAMPDGGRLTLEVSDVELSREFVKPFAVAAPGSFVRIAVSDTGSGIDEATRQRIFEPFFTTKEVGKGTGLGLSISYGIAKQNGGFLTVDSKKGDGTTFSLYLPLATTVPAQRSAAAGDAKVPCGDETVLLVEDNDEVRNLISRVMTSRGYRVIEAVDGADGVEKFRKHQAEVELAILDVIMPKVNGGDAYKEMLTLNSGLRTIFISGYTGDIIDRQRVFEDGGNFLQKPILPEKLLGMVRAALDN